MSLYSPSSSSSIKSTSSIPLAPSSPPAPLPPSPSSPPAPISPSSPPVRAPLPPSSSSRSVPTRSTLPRSSTSSLKVSSASIASQSSSLQLPTPSISANNSTSSPAVAVSTSNRAGHTVAIVLGVLTAILAITALVISLCYRLKRRRLLRNESFFTPDLRPKKSFHIDLESATARSNKQYPSQTEQTSIAAPLLQNTRRESFSEVPLTGRSTSSAQTFNPPAWTYLQHETSTRALSTYSQIPAPPPPTKPRQFLSLQIPEYTPPQPVLQPLTHQSPDSDSPSQSDLGENIDIASCSPTSAYSQPSATLRLFTNNPVSRGPSVSSHVSIPRLSAPPSYLETIEGTSEESITSSDETITPATHGHASSTSPPPPPGLGFLNTDPDFGLSRYLMTPSSHQESTSEPGLERQSTKAVASLLQSRLRGLAKAVSVSHSGVEPIERAGSIKPLELGDSMDKPEPYGRRFRRLKAEREMKAFRLDT